MLELSKFESAPILKSSNDFSQWKDSLGSSHSFRKGSFFQHCSIYVKASTRKTLHSEDTCWFDEKSLNYRKPKIFGTNNV